MPGALHVRGGGRPRKKLATDSDRQFALTLALACGRLDVDGVLEQLTPRQFAEWQAFYRSNPWGPERGDLRSGLLACALQILHWGEGGWEPDDFVMFPRSSAAAGSGAINGWEDTTLLAEKCRLLGQRFNAGR